MFNWQVGIVLYINIKYIMLKLMQNMLKSSFNGIEVFIFLLHLM